MYAELAESCEQAIDSFCTVSTVEVIGSEVVPISLVTEHVPSGGRHRSGDGEDGFLGATASAQSVELCLQVTALDADGRPSGLDEGGLEPVAAMAQAGTAAFAGALVVARTQSGPGKKMS